MQRKEFIPTNAKKKIPACSLFIDKQMKWWDEKECIIQKESIIESTKLFEEYNPIDEYDEYSDEFQGSMKYKNCHNMISFDFTPKEFEQ